MTERTNNKMRTYDLVCIALFAAIIAVCSWISIPMTVPFTLQTLGVFLAVGILGGKRGTMAVLVYILLGAIGVPVFAGFTGGIGVIAGMTGGYIAGFLLSALVMWAAEKLPGYEAKRNILLPISMVVGLLICYIFGTVWFMIVYTRTQGAMSIGAVLGMCVVPFIIPDTMKIVVAVILSKKLKRIVK